MQIPTQINGMQEVSWSQIKIRLAKCIKKSLLLKLECLQPCQKLLKNPTSSLQVLHKTANHPQHQFPEWIERHSKCIHRKDKEVIKSNTAHSSKPQTPLTMSTLVGYSPTTFDAIIATMIIETKFSTPIMKSSSQSLVTLTVTSTKDNISTVLIVSLLVAW
jgi:hypothetical protein